jgi:GNAT superfamily N-acetyltransferase
VIAIEVLEIGAADTYPLRKLVLRDGTRSSVLAFEGDELDTTFHLGARCDGELVGISTWLDRAYPDRPAERAFQLRGMATHPDRRGHGAGDAMLVAGLDRCRSLGAALVWARARDTALGFYVRHGFATVGPGYTDLTTGLPHHDIVVELR